MTEQANTSSDDAANEAVGAVPVENVQYRLLGARLKKLREMRGLSLQDVARETELSQSFLSMLERGKTDLSLSRFIRLLEFYELQPSDVIMGVFQQQHAPGIRWIDDARLVDRGPGIRYLIIREERPQMVFAELEPESRFLDPRAHDGEDHWIVLRGTVVLHYGLAEFEIAERRIVRFSATIPHSFSNQSAERAEILGLTGISYW